MLKNGRIALKMCLTVSQKFAKIILQFVAQDISSDFWMLFL
jgi:hypothetical protein